MDIEIMEFFLLIDNFVRPTRPTEVANIIDLYSDFNMAFPASCK